MKTPFINGLHEDGSLIDFKLMKLPKDTFQTIQLINKNSISK
jgi:hypothetical protein